MTYRKFVLFAVLAGLGIATTGCTRFMQSEGIIKRDDGKTVVTGAVRVDKPTGEEDSSRFGRDGESGEPIPGPAEHQVFKGSGIVIQKPPARPASSRVTPSGDVVINFVNADIREVMKAVLGRTLRVNYVIDPGVKGTITIQTSRPMARSAVIPTLESALPLVGATLVVTDGLHRIVPLAKAPRSGAYVSVGEARAPNLPGYGIRIVPLQFIGAGEMKKILEPMLPEGGILEVDSVRNLLIMGGTRRDIENLLDTVQIFDIDWMKGMSVGLFPLEHVGVETLLKDLDAVFGSRENGPLAGLVRLMPIERLNAILAVTAQPGYIEEIRKWVDRLDRGAEGPGRRLFVYFVQNGKATDLATVLGEAIGFEKKSAAPSADLAPGLKPAEMRSPGSGAPTRAPRTSASTAPGTQSSPAGSSASGAPTARTTGSRSTAGTSDTSRRSTTGGPVTYGSSTSGQSAKGNDLAANGEFRIVADEGRNALLITATPAEFRLIEQALKKLDIIPLQVLLEATIAEVTLRDQLQYGLQWFFQSGNNQFTFSSAAGGGVAPTFPGFSYFFSSTNASAALNALTDLTDVNVISSPQLLVLNNATATLTVGDQVPIATQSSVSSSDPDAPIVNSIQYRDTGVTLRVTPRVNFGGLVTLEIEEETSEVVETTTSGIDSPTIQQRKITSTVAVHAGETVALGGLIKDTTSNTKSGLPLLSAIPIIGALFRSTSDDARRTELLVLITPRVITSRADARKVTEELRKRLRGLRPLDQRIR